MGHARRGVLISAFVHPTKGIRIPDSFDLLGRDLAHWSTFFNTRVAGSPFTQPDGRPRFSGMAPLLNKGNMG